MIYQATYQDRPHFLRLWAEHRKEQRDLGDSLHATTRNLLNFAGYFDSYTMGQMFGFCLLWTPDGEETPQGIIMFGEETKIGEWDTDRPKCAILWGVYVCPEYRGQGMGLKLELAALPVGIKMGFRYIETMVLTINKHGEKVALDFGTTAESERHVADGWEIAKKLGI